MYVYFRFDWGLFICPLVVVSLSLFCVEECLDCQRYVFLPSVLTFHSSEQDLTTLSMYVSYVSLKHNFLGGVPCLSGAWNNKSQPLLWFWHTWHGTERSTCWNARLISFDTHIEVGPLQQRETRNRMRAKFSRKNWTRCIVGVCFTSGTVVC